MHVQFIPAGQCIQTQNKGHIVMEQAGLCGGNMSGLNKSHSRYYTYTAKTKHSPAWSRFSSIHRFVPRKLYFPPPVKENIKWYLKEQKKIWEHMFTLSFQPCLGCYFWPEPLIIKKSVLITLHSCIKGITRSFVYMYSMVEDAFRSFYWCENTTLHSKLYTSESILYKSIYYMLIP